MGTRFSPPQTDTQRHLDAEFEALFGAHTLPHIAPPLTPTQQSEAEMAGERG